MAAIPSFQFNITGASGSQGLLSPKSGWRAYIFPRGANASQDSTGTLITFDSAATASRFSVNNWVQVGTDTSKIVRVTAVGGNSMSVTASVTVSENDRVFLIGNTQPTVVGGSATYTIPNTLVRQRGDDAADLYTNSMITSNSDGLIHGYASPNMYDAMIQDGNQANQGYIADLEVGTVEGVSVTDWAFFGSTVTMHANLGVTGTIVVGATASFLAGTSFTGRAVFGQTVTAVNLGGIRYADAFPGANAGEKIANALADLPTSGAYSGIVDARSLAGNPTTPAEITTNIFSGNANRFTLLLGVGVYRVSAGLRLQDNGQIIRGEGRNSTSILAHATNFPASTAVFSLGKTTGVFGTRLKGLAIDCNGVTGSIGVLADGCQEGSGCDDVQVSNCRDAGFRINSALAASSTQQASFYEIDASGTTSGFIGVDVGNAAGTLTIRRVGVGSSVANTDGIKIDSSASVFISDAHVEDATNGVHVVAAGGSVIVENFVGHATLTNCINIETQNVTCIGITPNGVTNTITDTGISPTNTFGGQVQFYSVGADGNRQVFSTNSNAHWKVNSPFSLLDGLTAPSAVAGRAYIYVDTADGDLKVKFGDGITKTIATDT